MKSPGISILAKKNSRFRFYTGLSTIFHVLLILVIEIRRPSIVELTAKKAGKNNQLVAVYICANSPRIF